MPSNTSYYDNTRVASFTACPRHYLFRHIKHWRPDSTPVYFTFGTCWHAAMDAIWRILTKHKDIDSLEVLSLSFAAFVEGWDKEIPQDFIPSLREMRNPGLARDMLTEYIQLRRSQIAQYKILAVEKPFVVPIIEGAEIFYIGRVDKVIQDGERIYFVEHKTTTSYKKDGGFRSDFAESFSPNSQIDGYIFQGKVTYGEEFKGVHIDAALVHKTARHFTMLPISKLEQLTEAWLWETRYWIMEIIDNTNHYEEVLQTGNEGPYLAAFPKKTSSCMKFQGYSRCSYYNLCKFGMENPAFKECPSDFIVDPWEPFKLLEKEEEKDE